MNKTLYVKDEDGPIWDKARELTGDKLSQFIMDKLRAFVSEREGQEQGRERIVLRFYEENLPRAKAFTGRWIFPPGEPFISYESVNGNIVQPHYLVAETAKGNFAVLEYHKLPEPNDEGNATIDGHYRFSTFYVVNSVEHMSYEISSVLASEVMKRMGVEVQELDI
jgi:hypothetical protein